MIHAYGEDPDVHAFLEMDGLSFCVARPPEPPLRGLRCSMCGCSFDSGFFLFDFYPHKRRGQWLRLQGFQIREFHSSRAIISPTAKLASGAIILPNSYIGDRVTVGVACKIGIGAQVHHGAVLEDFVTIAPGAIVLGGGRVSESSILGSGSVLRQERSVGPRSYVGMGAVVVSDIGEGVVAFGNPARSVRNYHERIEPA